MAVSRHLPQPQILRNVVENNLGMAGTLHQENQLGVNSSTHFADNLKFSIFHNSKSISVITNIVIKNANVYKSCSNNFLGDVNSEKLTRHLHINDIN